MAKKKLPKGVRERNGKYHFRFDVIDPATGNRKQKETPGFRTPNEASKEGIRIQAEIMNGTYIEESKLTFSDFADRWLKLYGARKIKPRTVDQRDSMIKIAKQRFGGLALSELNLMTYQQTLQGLKEEEYSLSTIRSFHATMRMLYRKALELELIKRDITNYAEIPSFIQTVEQLESNTEIPEYLEKEELGKLLITAKEHADVQISRILYVLAHTGLRIGELSALRISDYDEVNRTLSITKTVYIRRSVLKYVLNTPKTKSSIRVIDISSKVVAIINEQLAWRNQQRMANRKTFYEKEIFLFFNVLGKPGYPLVAGYVRKYMSEILKTAELPTIFTPHSLRHTFTSLMAEAGVDLVDIQRMLGHKDDRTTKDVYYHVTKTRKKTAVEKLDKLLSGLF